jgi:hypothetical protein
MAILSIKERTSSVTKESDQGLQGSSCSREPRMRAEEKNMSTWQLGVGLVACTLVATCAGGCADG